MVNWLYFIASFFSSLPPGALANGPWMELRDENHPFWRHGNGGAGSSSGMPGRRGRYTGAGHWTKLNWANKSQIARDHPQELRGFFTPRKSAVGFRRLLFLPGSVFGGNE